MKSSKKIPVARIIHEEHPNLEKHDWRLHAATTITKDAVVNGHLFPAGSVITAASPLRVSRKGDNLNFGAPNVTAMLLDLADQLDAKSSMLHEEVIALAKAGKYDASDDVRLFDALENRMGAAVFAYTALESFANEIIEVAFSKGYQYEQKLKSGIIVSRSIETVERKISLDEKLVTIVPEALGIKSAKGRTAYNQYKRIKEIRDRIIHLKGRDRGNSQDKTLWRELMSSKSADFATQAYSLMAYYYNQKPAISPRWFSKFAAKKSRA